MMKLLLTILAMFPLLVFATEEEASGRKKISDNECVMNNTGTEIACADGRIYKLEKGTMDISYRVNTKSDLVDRAPASK